jgi:hypothetical protein
MAAAPALALDAQEAERMELTNDGLIAEAIAVNYRNVKPKTLAKYARTSITTTAT